MFILVIFQWESFTSRIWFSILRYCLKKSIYESIFNNNNGAHNLTERNSIIHPILENSQNFQRHYFQIACVNCFYHSHKDILINAFKNQYLSYWKHRFWYLLRYNRKNVPILKKLELVTLCNWHHANCKALNDFLPNKISTLRSSC